MQPLLPNDLYHFVLGADPQIAPDGAAMIFQRIVIEAEKDATTSSLWHVRISDVAAKPFTIGPDDRLPRFAGDGMRIAFVRNVDEAARIHVMPVDGGEPRPVGEQCKAISALAWSPDGRHIAYAATAALDPLTAHIYVDDKTGARHISALPYKRDPEGLLDGRRAHLFVLDVASNVTRQLTSGDFDVGEPSWSPDGTTIACTLSGAMEASMIADIALVDVKRGEMRRLTHSNGPSSVPAFSPDGRRVAWIGHQHGNDTRYHSELFVALVNGGEARSLSIDTDRPSENTINSDLRSASTAVPCWYNEHQVAALVTDGPNTSLRAFDVDSSEISVLADGEREIYAFSFSSEGRIAIAYSTSLVPSEIATLTRGGPEKCLTDLNPWLKDRQIVEPRRLRAIAEDGTELDYWLMMPAATLAPPPAALEIHGGPHATYGNTFFLEFQILAGSGIALIYGNPRGSAGYGQAFASAITGRWGGLDASDLNSILDAALAAEALDDERVAAVGGSYGGSMTTWLLGHSGRFATGISMRACNDFVSFTGATDIGYFLNAELGLGLDRDAMRALFEQSPIRWAEHIDVPLLIMHSEADYRCPIDQGEQLFNLLRMNGKKEVEFVRFTADGHGLSRSGKPRNRILRLRSIARWLLRHLCGTPSASDEAVAGDLFCPLPNETDAEADVDSGGPTWPTKAVR